MEATNGYHVHTALGSFGYGADKNTPNTQAGDQHGFEEDFDMAWEGSSSQSVSTT
jgi:hypothetical protein